MQAVAPVYLVVSMGLYQYTLLSTKFRLMRILDKANKFQWSPGVLTNESILYLDQKSELEF